MILQSTSRFAKTVSPISTRTVKSKRTDHDILNSEDEKGRGCSATTDSLGRFFGRRAEDFFIELEEPHKIYGPGEVVRGQVNLTLRTNVKTSYLRLRFYGQVRIGAGKNRVKTILFQESLVLWGHAKDQPETIARSSISTSPAGNSTTSIRRSENMEVNFAELYWQPATMQAGRHVFEFEFTFAARSLPSTVEFGRGSISYILRCEHQRPPTLVTRGLSICRKDLSFSDTIDVGHLNASLIRHIDHESKRKEGASKIQASVELARTGFLKGETIALLIHIHHVKAIKNMQGTIATLYRLSRFHSHELAPQSFRKDLCQSISPLLIDPQTLEYKVSPRLRIPTDVFPTIRSAGPVSFRYFVEVVLDLSSKTNARINGMSNRSGSYANVGATDASHMIETDALKRERGVDCIVFEVVIGTKSSVVLRQYNSCSSTPSGYAERLEVADHDSHDPHHISTSCEDLPMSNRTRERTRRPEESSNSELLTNPPQLLEPVSPFPLSKTALLELENALLPSLPPGNDASPLEDTVGVAMVPTMSVLGDSIYGIAEADSQIARANPTRYMVEDNIAHVVEDIQGNDSGTAINAPGSHQVIGICNGQGTNALPIYHPR